MLAIITQDRCYVIGLNYFELLSWFEDNSVIDRLAREGEDQLDAFGPGKIALHLQLNTDEPMSYDFDAEHWEKVDVVNFTFNKSVYIQLNTTSDRVYFDLSAPEKRVLVDIGSEFGRISDQQAAKLSEYMKQRNKADSFEEDQALRRKIVGM